MTIIERLNIIPIPPIRECGETLSKDERLKTYFYKLEIAPHCESNDDAFNLINEILIEVEDCHSGIAAEENPGLNAKHRMYPIQEDFVYRENNRIIARSKGNNIVIENNGEFTIRDRETDLVILSKLKQN